MLKFRVRDYRHQLLILCVTCGATATTTTAGADDLSAALQATLRHHPAVAGQEAQVTARRYAADEVRSQRYPTLTAQALQYAGGRSPVSGEDTSRPAALRVRQPLWAFGRINNSIAAAKIVASGFAIPSPASATSADREAF